MAGNVNLIDPNNANINPNIINGIPQYQDMYITAELIGISRGRTVLTTNSKTNITEINDASLEENKVISFLGENQDPNNSAHYNQFTTNWYDGAVDKDKTYEGFGINNINIITNSSYIPQINIEFIDIRGLAFFNRENSPYRILFDFPPPIFKLTLKGYYGKAITYQMHLVKYNTTFKAETGNYHIDAQFIAITYAPLTDVLFRYAVQAPLMLKNKKNQDSLSSKTSEKPKNTFDLILKAEQVYTEIPEKLKTDIDNQRYENSQKKLKKYTNIFDVLFNFNDSQILKKNGGNPTLITYNDSPDSDDNGEIKILNNFVEYNEYLKTFANKDLNNNVSKKLYIGYDFNIKSNENNTNNENINELKKILNEYKEFLLEKTKLNFDDISDEDIIDAEKIYNQEGAEERAESFFIRILGIDITDFYIKLYKGKTRIEEEKRNTMNDLNEKINNMIEQRLGMLPTIYNVFEILLNDVDDFFQILRNTSIDAENHHERYKKQIVNSGTYKDVNKDIEGNTKIYPFPLIIRQEKICDKVKEERRAPIEISRLLDNPFPELKLVQDFIDSFIKYNRIYEQATLKDDRTANGDYKWIPFTPADSKTVTTSLNSPYFGTDSPDGGSFEQPINLAETNKLNQIFEIFIQRFYLLFQNSFAFTMNNEYIDNDLNLYYSNNKTRNEIKKEYIKLYANAEALNLSNSIINESYGLLLENFSTENNNLSKLNNQQNGFYQYLKNNLEELYNNKPIFYEISNGVNLYRNRKEDGYKGIEFISMEDIEYREGTPNDEFETFIEDNKSSFWKKITGYDNNAESTFSFSNENLIVRRDTVSIEERKRKTTPLKTKFLMQDYLIEKDSVDNRIKFLDPEAIKITNYNKIIDKLSDEGNKYFFDNNIKYDAIYTEKEKTYMSIVDMWSQALGFFDTQIFDTIIDINDTNKKYNKRLAQLLFLSNFGNTLSPFNYYPYFLNRDYFTTPSIIEIPKFLQLYLGCLVGIKKNDSFWDEIYNFFVKGDGINLYSGGALIFADIFDINDKLSEYDKNKFKTVFDDWSVNEFPRLSKKIYELYKKVNDEYVKACQIKIVPIRPGKPILINREDKALKCKKRLYESYLNPEEREQITYANILQNLTKRIGLACYNEITFNFFNTKTENYQSLNEMIDNNKEDVGTYFSLFFRELEELISKRREELENETESFKSSTGDEDIITQTYYSFKNINDKWIAGLNKNIEGYPFKSKLKGDLINQFMFVDRAMNPIGDTIIDLKPLVDSINNPETTIFSIISQLLSLNGFEFFPLQNFLKFKENEWRNCFEIYTGSKQTQAPAFICMYIGGTSSYPTGINKFNAFKDDGIVDLENPGVGDFNVSTDNCGNDPEKDNQLNVTDNKDVYSQVRAFRVRYGEQNQNMFHDFSIDSKEYPETNESIQILSRLAGDEGEQAPVPKNQNLYNLYENRAYKATVSAFGNAMIQPTQYFQLENVPLFNGAYVILSVEHNIIPNKMTTKFSGTKILKYPMPRVLNPASIVGFEGGSTTETNIDEATIENVTLGVGVGNNPQQTQYNTMYEERINF